MNRKLLLPGCLSLALVVSFGCVSKSSFELKEKELLTSQSKLTKLQKHVKKLSKEQKSLKKESEQLTADLTQAHGSLDANKGTISQLETQVKELEAQEVAKKERIVILEKKIKEIEVALAAVKLKNYDLTSNLTATTKELEEDQKKYKELSKQKDSLHAAMIVMEGELGKLKNELLMVTQKRNSLLDAIQTVKKIVENY